MVCILLAYDGKYVARPVIYDFLSVHVTYMYTSVDIRGICDWMSLVSSFKSSRYQTHHRCLGLGW